jgi:hypothetical protein
MGESQSSEDASRFRALGNGVSGAGQGSAGDNELHDGSIASQAVRAYPNGGRSLVSDVGLFDTLRVGSNQYFGFSHSASGNPYDEQSLSFAFEGMGFDSRKTNSPTSHHNVPLTNGHYPSERVDGTLSQQHAPATRQCDSLGLQFSVQHAMQNNDVEHQEQSPRFPPQLGTFSRNPELHSFDRNFGVPCHPSIASASSLKMWQSQMYTPHDQNVGSNFMWQQNTGVQPYSIMQPNYACPQMQQVSGFGISRHRSNEQAAVYPPAKGPSSSYIGTPNFHWLENGYSYLNGAASQKRRNSGGLNNTFADSFPSTSYTGSSCGSGDFHHFQWAEKVFNSYGPYHQQGDNLSHPYGLGLSHHQRSDIAHPYGLGFSHHQRSDKLNTASYVERIRMRPDVGNSVNFFDLSSYARLLNSPFLSSQSDTYKSIDEVMGSVCMLSKDQDACRFLQKLLSEGTQEDIDKIFGEIIDNVGDLMVDPTAHYLVQKILEECTNDQRTHMIREITKAPIKLHKASCNVHGYEHNNLYYFIIPICWVFFKKGRRDAVLRAVLLSDQVVGSKHLSLL